MPASAAGLKPQVNPMPAVRDALQASGGKRLTVVMVSHASYPSLGIKPGPITPEGVSARTVQGRTLYVNTKNAPVTVTFDGTKKGVLTHRTYAGKIDLAAYGVELLQR